MGENDRLQREKTLACAKHEEELKRSESARSALESLQASNQNLLAMHETDKALMARKDRKIDELREALAAEKSKKEQADNDAKAIRAERDFMVQKLMKESMEEREQTKRSTSQYEILSKSWKSQEEKYSRDTQKLRGSIKALRDELEEEKQKVARLDIISEQLHQEHEKSMKAKDKMTHIFRAYKDEQQRGLRAITEKAERNEITHDELLTEINTVLGEMRYVVNIQKDLRGAD